MGFLGAAAFQWINPKSWLVCASAAATFLEPGAGRAAAQAAILGLLIMMIVLVVRPTGLLGTSEKV